MFSFDSLGQLLVAAAARLVNTAGALVGWGTAARVADGDSGEQSGSVVVYGWDGSGLRRKRTPVVFKNIAGVAVTAGTPVGVWTPAAGKRFRLMGWALWTSSAAAVLFKDGATEVLRHGSGPYGGTVSPPLGNGYLSILANNALNLDVSASCVVHGIVYGTEE